MLINTKELDNLSRPDTYAVVCEFLYNLKEDPKYSPMSELAYLLDKDSFVKLIKYFGGTEIKIPTAEEFKETLRVIMLYQHFKVENLSWAESLEKSGISKPETRKYQYALIKFEEDLRRIQVGRHYA